MQIGTNVLIILETIVSKQIYNYIFDDLIEPTNRIEITYIYIY